MKINTFKLNKISFTLKSKNIHFNYVVGDLLNVRTDCVKDIGIILDCKLHFHRHFGTVRHCYIFSVDVIVLFSIS
jgi:hypothetical protein